LKISGKKTFTRSRSIFRLKIILCFLILVLIGIVYRAAEFQIIDSKTYKILSDKQNQRVFTLIPRRGTIYDAGGNGLAVSVRVGSIFAQPPQIKDIRAVSKALSPHLEIDRATLEKALRSNKQFLWLKRQTSPENAEKIAQMAFDGIGVVWEFKRYYPNKELASVLLGFTGLDGEGLEGVEYYYDDYLKGQQGYLFAERDAYGRTIITEPSDISVSGGDIYLTINKSMQYIVEEELRNAVESSRAKKGVSILMDVKTGKVLAMSQYPGFNPNAFSQYSPDVWRNSAVTDIYEPGSTFKTFLFAAAYEEGAIYKNDVFYCENGEYSIASDIVIHDVKKFSVLNAEEVFKFSSNICASKIAKRLGKEKFLKYVNAFGFGTKSGISLPGDGKGIVKGLNKLTEVDNMILGFGQGISTTPIQLIAAFNSVVNDGEFIKPAIVQEIRANGQTVYNYTPEVTNRVVSAKTTRFIRDIMVKVVTEGTGPAAFIDGFGSGGKTGTAQKVDTKTGRYSSEKFTSYFIGFAPAKNPLFTLLVLIDEPEGTSYGGVVAAPVFKNIGTRVLSMLNAEREKVPTPDIENLFVDAADNLIVPTSGGVYKPSYYGSDHMPNLTGLTYREVLDLVMKRGLKANLIGSGFVVDQRPGPGTLIRDGQECLVRFEPLD